MSQRFRASDDTFTWPNGAVGYRPAGSWDCLGPFAKVKIARLVILSIG